jgi:hypothetical protein
MLANWPVSPNSAKSLMLSRCQRLWTISLEDLSSASPYGRLSTPSDFRQGLWNLGKSSTLRGLPVSLAEQPRSKTQAIWRLSNVWFPRKRIGRNFRKIIGVVERQWKSPIQLIQREYQVQKLAFLGREPSYAPCSNLSGLSTMY